MGTYYRDPITFCTSIIESLEENRSLLILSEMEKSKKNISRNLQVSTGLLAKIHTPWMNMGEIMNF